MSATHDSSQKPTFVYTNLYSLFRKSREVAQSQEALQSAQFVPVRGVIPKSEVVGAKPYRPVEFLSQRQARTKPASAVSELKSSLHELKGLQSKLKFLLSELETELTPKKPIDDSDE